MGADTINALSQAGVGIAAIVAVLAQIALMVLLVRMMSRVGLSLAQAIRGQTISTDQHTNAIEAVRADLNKNTTAILDMEVQLAHLPAQVRAEVAPSLYQLLQAIERVSKQSESQFEKHSLS